jgi:hypothetical protein
MKNIKIQAILAGIALASVLASAVDVNPYGFVHFITKI